MKTVVIGCGAWGTTLAHVMAIQGSTVSLLCHSQDIMDEIVNKRTHKNVLPEGPLINPRVTPQPMTTLCDEVLVADFVFVAVASNYYRAVLREIVSVLTKKTIIISATKGMETKTNCSVFDIATDELPVNTMRERFVVLSGPNLASEIFRGLPAATVIACRTLDTAKRVQSVISSPRFRAYISEDIIGVEYGGILKNIIAIAAGIIDAKKLGSNAKAALLVRGMAEMKRYAISEGAKDETLQGLSGFGDLITTCLGPQSRNYTVGFKLGLGETLSSILEGLPSIAEGVNACLVTAKRSREKHIAMPVTEAIEGILLGKLTIESGIDSLMTRALKAED